MLLPDFSARQEGFAMVAGITNNHLHNMRLHLVDVSRSLLPSIHPVPADLKWEIAGKPGPDTGLL